MVKYAVSIDFVYIVYLKYYNNIHNVRIDYSIIHSFEVIYTYMAIFERDKQSQTIILLWKEMLPLYIKII